MWDNRKRSTILGTASKEIQRVPTLKMDRLNGSTAFFEVLKDPIEVILKIVHFNSSNSLISLGTQIEN